MSLCDKFIIFWFIYLYFFRVFSEEASDGETPKMHHLHSARGGSSTGEQCTQFFSYIFNSTFKQSVIYSTHDKKIHIKKYFYYKNPVLFQDPGNCRYFTFGLDLQSIILDLVVACASVAASTYHWMTSATIARDPHRYPTVLLKPQEEENSSMVCNEQDTVSLWRT